MVTAAPDTVVHRDGVSLPLYVTTASGNPSAITHGLPDATATAAATVASDSPLVLVFPALGVPAAYYAPLAEALRDAGLTSVTADLRGATGPAGDLAASSRGG